MIMTRMPNIISVGPEDSIYEACVKIEQGEIDALPVLSDGKDLKVVGRITKTNINRLMVDLGGDDEQ